MAKRRVLVTALETGLLDKAEALVRQKRTLPRAKLPEWKNLAPVAQEQMIEELVARGLEVGDKGALRVALRDQVGTLVQGGARPAWKTAPKRINGASTAERDAALARAFGEASLHLVVRTKVDTVVSGKEAVLSQDDVARLVKAHTELDAVLKLVRKKLSSKGPLAKVPKTLLSADAAELLAPFAAWGSEALIRAVMERLTQMEEPPILLVWVPALVKSLTNRMTTAQAREALFSASQRGLLELRPESGVGRLDSEDAALCPHDGDGVPLSHARRLSAR